MPLLLLPALGRHEADPKADELLECLQIPGVDNGYCKWGLVIGEDWSVLNGLGEGVTQLARRGRGVQAFTTGSQKCVPGQTFVFAWIGDLQVQILKWSGTFQLISHSSHQMRLAGQSSTSASMG